MARKGETTPPHRATLTATAGPNEGDAVSIDVGTCRLIGRHLSEQETAFIDRDGNRVLDGPAAEILTQHLKNRAPATGTVPASKFTSESFERGADIIFADDSISRAHAMVFYDASGFGVIDLASTNGTFVNAERLASGMMREGDVLALGNSELTLKMR